MIYAIALASLCYLIVNAFFDINHALNMIFVTIMEELFYSEKKKLTDSFQHKDICLTTDLDIFWHMNNSRYLRMGDIGRLRLLHNTGVWKIVKDLGGFIVAGGYTVRFRKSITLLTSYTLESKIIYWDPSAFYVEQQFIRNSDNFVCCIAIVKQSVSGGVTTDQVLQKLGYEVMKPVILPELEKWIESIQLSSERLRKVS